jgi:pyruvate kinase
MLCEGMDVARLNLSHGSHENHRATFETVRAVADELGRNVAVLMDLQGPKIRTGALDGGQPVLLETGACVRVTTKPLAGNARCIATTYERLPTDVRPGDRILLADGAMELRVESAAPPDVECVVVRGGVLGEHKGINLPGVAVSAPCLTEKDLADLDFGLKLGVDFVALSFVRSAEDIRDIKRRIDAAGPPVPVIAKIERPEALNCLDEILALSDGVMVARGDLGVEMNLQDVPQIQKALIAECNRKGVPVITATQMLESMMTQARPTRAEVNDVANAIYDGTDAVMLSGETAAGQYPVEAVRMMAEVAARADEATSAEPPWAVREAAAHERLSQASFSRAIGHAVYGITQTLPAKRVVCFTTSGHTARVIARYRPPTPITAFTLSPETLRRCAIVWGVDAVETVEATSTDQMVASMDAALLDGGLADPGDTVIIVAGMPLAVGGRTNMMRLHTVGEAADT